MSKKGILLVLSGFSGAGKGTVVSELMKRDDFYLSISATTRAPRKGEEDGREYFFLTEEAFKEKIAAGDLLEWAQFSKHYYGTPKAAALEQTEKGRDVILEIDSQGAFQVKKQYPEAVLVFLCAPSMKTVEERLRGRGTETEEQISSRLKMAEGEIEIIDRYDYLLVNDDLTTTVDKVLDIMEVSRERVCEKKQLIAQFRQELKEMI